MTRRPPIFARIASRIFALDILLVLVPVLALGLLRNYEKSLLESLENGMSQQARIIAAWLSQGTGPVRPPEAKKIILALGQKHTVRIRVVDTDFSSIADSSMLAAMITDSKTVALTGIAPAKEAESTLLYRLMSLPVRLWRKYFAPPAQALESADYYSQRSAVDGPEIREALAGRYGSATRISSGGQTSVTLYAAVPITRAGKISGAVLVSQSTFKILRELYALRLDAARTFAFGILLAAAVTLILSLTISWPLARLAAAAREAFSRPGGLARASFHDTKRLDEIGDLERALAGYARGLEERAMRAEGFASDVAHELRNPIASAAVSMEMASQAEAPEDRERFLCTAQAELRRMDTLIGGLRSLAAAESTSANENKDAHTNDAVGVLLGAAQAAVQTSVQDSGIKLVFKDVPEEKIGIAIRPSLLASVMDNLIRNAVSFSKPGSELIVSFRVDKGSYASLEFQVDDSGPGVPAEHLDHVFDRFFTWRPQEKDKRAHTGLGLAIVAAAARSTGGKAWVKNLPSGGASFTVSLPVCQVS